MRLMALLFILGISSCEVKVGTGNSDKESNTTASGNESKSNKIRNGILLKENGLDVDEAYLTVNDGSLLSNENKVDINDIVKMNLVMGGWKVENDKVFVGASEKVLTSEGYMILNEADLFANFTEGVNANDAKYINLSVQLTKMTKVPDHFLVEFRVWDKKSNADVSGSYKLYLK